MGKALTGQSLLRKCEHLGSVSPKLLLQECGYGDSEEFKEAYLQAVDLESMPIRGDKLEGEKLLDICARWTFLSAEDLCKACKYTDLMNETIFMNEFIHELLKAKGMNPQKEASEAIAESMEEDGDYLYRVSMPVTVQFELKVSSKPGLSQMQVIERLTVNHLANAKADKISMSDLHQAWRHRKTTIDEWIVEDILKQEYLDA